MNIFQPQHFLKKVFCVSCLVSGAALLPTTVSADAMTIVNDNVGIGIDNPSGSLHILRTGGLKPAIVIETQGGAIPSKWEIKSNPGTGRLTFKDLNGTTTPFKFEPTAVSNLLRVGVLNPYTVDIAGDLVVHGDCSENDGPCADYVFEDDYELRSLDQLSEFISENKHLPNVPSAAAMEKNGVNMANLSGRLLEKIEELTLYTLQQEETIDSLKDLVGTQSKMVEELELRLQKIEDVAQ